MSMRDEGDPEHHKKFQRNDNHAMSPAEAILQRDKCTGNWFVKIVPFVAITE
jgi:hypothetical protein